METQQSFDDWLDNVYDKTTREEENMANLKQEAQSYTAPQTKNIAELDKVPVDADVQTKEFTRDDGTAFTIKVIKVNGEEYRVPLSVLKSLKAILEVKPELTHFKVSKSGEGLKTTYTIIT